MLASDGNFYGTTTYGGTNGGNGTIYRMSPNGAISNLHSFGGGNDGAHPYCTLVQGTDGNLYGTCYGGGADGLGTVFKMTTNGTFTTLYSFTGGSDSANPAAGLIQCSDGNFYGTASGSSDYSNSSDYGDIFHVTPDGTFSILYSFNNDGDGANPHCALVQGTDGNLYGTCSGRGYLGAGTVFQVTTNGALTTLYTFTDLGDGYSPEAGLIQGKDGNFYGTSSGFDDGGYYNYGAVFSITTNGTFTTLYSFTDGSDGGDPYGPLLQSTDGTLYGTTEEGGSNGLGTIFNIPTNGGTLTTIHTFSGGTDGANPVGVLIQAGNNSLLGTTAYGNTNGAGTICTITRQGIYATMSGFPGILDGANPSADLAMGKDGNFYGTAEGGGATGNGTVFAATVGGAVTVLHSFGTVTDAVTGALLDGTFPKGKPAQGNDGCIYGTTSSGGANGYGTVFKVTTNGTFTVLYSFGAVPDNFGPLDGGNPEAGLVQGQDGSLYGTCSFGGAYWYCGTVFQITTNGTFSTIHSFTGSYDGSDPVSPLVQGTDGNLYGTCYAGGVGYGTVFQLTTNGTCNNLYTFTGGSDSCKPEAGLVQAADGNFYGTASGYYDNGAVFRITTNGDFTTLYSFPGGTDGACPEAGLIQGPDGNLYGTTAFTNENETGNGTVFQITTNGNLTTLWDFTGSNDGANPDDGLVAGSNGTFYGSAENGGAGGFGTLFQINLAPALQPPTIASGTITFNWNAVPGLEYQIEFTTNLVQSEWVNLGTAFVASNQTNQVQDSIGPGPQRFYRAEMLPGPPSQ